MNRVKKRLVMDQPRDRWHPLESGGEKITTFVPAVCEAWTPEGRCRAMRRRQSS